jgi:predicted acylesterase/phospholipase RssA
MIGTINIAAPPPIRFLGGPALPFVGFALSGGGLKGAFEVGALKYLMQGKSISPDILTCTSVGAVNGLKLAEGEGRAAQGAKFQSGLAGLEQIWLGLTGPQDVFVPSGAVAKLGVDAYNALDLLLSQIETNFLQAAGNVAAQGAPWIFLFGPLGAPFVSTAPVNDLLNNLLALAQQATALFALTPIGDLLDSGALNPKLLETSGKDLALATVDLTSGLLRFVRLAQGLATNGRAIGYLCDRDQLPGTPLKAYQVSDPIDMKIGMLASAAAPLYFEPQTLKMNEVSGIYTDGGVRALTPVQAAMDLGAKRVFAIDCNAAPGGAGLEQIQGLLSLGPRVLALLLEEIDRSGTLPPSPDQVRYWYMRPLYEVQGDMEVDPGAIRVNIDYGYMCAFDAVDGSVRSAARASMLQSLAQRAAILRRQISDWERCSQWAVLAMALSNPPSGGFSLQDLVNKLNYHRYPGDSDMNGREANLQADLETCGCTVGSDGHVTLTIGNRGESQGLDVDLSRPRWPASTSTEPPRQRALQILQSMKSQIIPLYDSRVRLAGPGAVPPDPSDSSRTDQPWMRWEQPASQAFFGDVWPKGSNPTAQLDDFTVSQLTGGQVERRGTSGWALVSGAYSQFVTGSVFGYGSPTLLVPSGTGVEYLAGVISYEPPPSTSASPLWDAPPAGSKWSSSWQKASPAPPDLGAPVFSVSACWVSEADSTAVQAVARVHGSGSDGDALIEFGSLLLGEAWWVLGPVVADGSPVKGVTGNPLILEAKFAQEESFELFVPIGSRVAHYFRRGRSGPWTSRGSGSAYPVPQPAGTPPQTSALPVTSRLSPVSIACIQANYGVPSNLEAVVALSQSGAWPATSLVSLWYDAEHGVWNEAGPIAPAGVDLSNIAGDPMLFQSKFGRQGDFELFVPAGEQVLHLFRDNDNGMKWGKRVGGVVYSGGTLAVGRGPTMIRPTPAAIAAWQSVSGGFSGNPDFHAILRVHSAMVAQGDRFLVLRFDTRTQEWQEVGDVSLNGQPLSA